MISVSSLIASVQSVFSITIYIFQSKMIVLCWAALLSIIAQSFAIPHDGDSTKVKRQAATFDYVIIGGGKLIKSQVSLI
jgi:hypothetical protein